MANLLIESSDLTMPDRAATMLRQRGARVYNLPVRHHTLAAAMGIEHFQTTDQVVKRARLEDPRRGEALEKCDALVIDGQQLVSTIRDGQLRRVDLYLRKLRKSDASFGGLRLVVVATSGDARSAVLEAASSPDKQLRSVVDRLDLSYA